MELPLEVGFAWIFCVALSIYRDYSQITFSPHVLARPTKLCNIEFDQSVNGCRCPKVAAAETVRLDKNPQNPDCNVIEMFSSALIFIMTKFITSIVIVIIPDNTV